MADSELDDELPDVGDTFDCAFSDIPDFVAESQDPEPTVVPEGQDVVSIVHQSCAPALGRLAWPRGPRARIQHSARSFWQAPASLQHCGGHADGN